MSDNENNIEVGFDDLIAELTRSKHTADERSSDASESASVRAKFNEETGLNNQAMTWAGAIHKKFHKKNGEQKAMDIIRSLDVLLPMLKDLISGNGTAQMDLDTPAPDAPKAETKPKAKKAKKADKPDVDSATYDAGKAAFAAGQDRDANPYTGDDEAWHKGQWDNGWFDAAELGDFGDEVDAAMPEGNVIPMGKAQ